MSKRRDEDYRDNEGSDSQFESDSYSDEQGSFSGSYGDEQGSLISDLPEQQDPQRPHLGSEDGHSGSDDDGDEPQLFDANDGFDAGSAFGKGDDMFGGDAGFGDADAAFGFDTTSSKEKRPGGFDTDAVFDDFGFGGGDEGAIGFANDGFGSDNGEAFGFGDAGVFGDDAGGFAFGEAPKSPAAKESAFGDDGFAETDDGLFEKDESYSGKDNSHSQDHSDYSGSQDDYSQSGRDHSTRSEDYSDSDRSGRPEDHSGREEDPSGRDISGKDPSESQEGFSDRDHSQSPRDHSTRSEDYSDGDRSGRPEDHSGREEDLSGRDNESFSGREDSQREEDFSGRDQSFSGRQNSHRDSDFSERDDGSFSGQDLSGRENSARGDVLSKKDLSHRGDDVSDREEGVFEQDSSSREEDFSRSDGSHTGPEDAISDRDPTNRQEDEDRLFRKGDDLPNRGDEFSGRDVSAEEGDYSGRDGSLSGRDLPGRENSYSGRDDESSHQADDNDADILDRPKDVTGSDEDSYSRNQSVGDEDYSGREDSARQEDLSGHESSFSGRDHSGHQEVFSDREHSEREEGFSGREGIGRLEDFSGHDDYSGRDNSYSGHDDSNPAESDTGAFAETSEQLKDDFSGSQEDTRGSYSEHKEDFQGGFGDEADFGFDPQASPPDDLTGSQQDEDNGLADGFQRAFDDDVAFGGGDDFGVGTNASSSDNPESTRQTEPDDDGFQGAFGDDMGFGTEGGFGFENKADEPADGFREGFDEGGEFGGWGAENGLVQPANSANQFGSDAAQSNDSVKGKDDSRKSPHYDVDPVSDEGSGNDDGSFDNVSRDASIDIDDLSQSESPSKRNKKKDPSAGGKALSPKRSGPQPDLYRTGRDDDDSNYSGSGKRGADEDESIDDSACQTGIDQDSRDFGADTLADTLDENTGHTGRLGFDSQENLDLGDEDKDDFYLSMSELRSEMEDQARAPGQDKLAAEDEDESVRSERSGPTYTEQEDLPPVEPNIREKLASRPGRPASYKRYTREQMLKVTSQNTDGKKKKSKQKKAEELIEFVTNVNEAILFLGELLEAGEAHPDSDSRWLLDGFESLVGIFLQISDEKELMATFAKGADKAAVEALDSLLKFAIPVNEIFVQLRPVVEHYFTHETDEEMNDLLFGMNLMVDLLCELSHRIGEKQEWNQRACTAYATLVELLARDTLEVASIYDDVDTPEYELSVEIEDAWNGTGHIEEFQTLEEAPDLAIFRQICYEVILSTDKWCPDIETLMSICGIEDVMLDEASDADDVDDSELAVPPETAIQVLDKINGDPLRRPAALASVLRRVLPGNKISDKTLAEHLTSIRSAMRSPLGLPASNLIGITSIPEVASDPEALGVAGVGKTTLAALVANHRDVRRHFCDGIAWIHLGQKELNYTRYIQCLRDLISQLEVPEEEEPAFPELLRTPSETGSQRRRREEGFLVFVRETMIAFLKKRAVLVILDDVCFESDLDWFDFGAPSDNPDDVVSSCVTLVTTRRRNLLPAADMVEVDMMDEYEAATLLVSESGDLAKSLSPESNETKSVVRECANHPLAVKSVGRWLNLKHATSGEEGDPEQLHKDVVQSMEKILKNGADDDADMMYEILNMSLSPAINGEPTSIIKFCFAAYVHVFCDKEHISDFALADATPIVPLSTVEMLFEALLGLEEENLRKEGSLFYADKKDAAVLIPTALSSLGAFKVITTLADGEDGEMENSHDAKEEKYLQIMHVVQQEYGEYLLDQDLSLRDLSVDAEKRWNKAIAKAYLATKPDWDSDTPDASLDYFLEMMPVHLIRGEMLKDAANLLCSPSFVKGRLFALGRENGTRRHIKDCETLYDLLMKKKATRKKYEPKATMLEAYETLGDHLKMDEDEFIKEEGSPEAVEVGRCRFEIGFSLAEKRIWEGAIEHWEASQELLVSALGMVEVVAGILYNIGVVYTEMNEYEQALGSLKQCLRVRGTIHGEEHILYAQTIQRIGDVFLSMSDYHEAMESYNWALDVMHIEPSHHRIDIGDILENMGKIHFYKGETDDALQCFQDSLQSKQTELGEDHPELFSVFEQIGNCLSEQGKVEDAIAHLEEAIRLKTLDQYGGDERDATVMTLQGVLSVRQGKQKAGLECYEKALQILVTKAPHKKEKIASLLHLIASVYLVGGESKKAMKLFEESLQARRKVLGFVHLDVASTLFSMAYLHQKRRRLDKALKCLEEALKIRQLRLPDSEKVAVTHEKIGTIARSIGKLKKAENAFSEALRIRKLIHGDNHPAVAKVMQDLGDLMDDLGEYEEAMRNYREAYRIRKSFGGDTLPVAETLYTIGFTYSNSGHYEKALECLDAALKIQRLHLGEDSPDCGDTLNMIGFLKAKCGQVDEAQEYLRDALRIRKLQGDSIKISETLKNIGNAHRSKQEYRSAMETYQECLKIRQKNLGREHDKVADALVAIGNIFADLSRSKEAMDAYQEALGIRARLFGDLDSSLAPILQAMGMLDFHGNNYDRSLQLLNDYISIRNGNKGARDGDYVNVLFTIGNIYQLRHDEQRAKKAWTEAYETFKDLGLAESNPEHAEQMEQLMRDHGLASVVEVSSQDDFGDEPSMRQKGGGVLKRLKQKVKRGDGQSGIRRRGKEKGQQL